MESKNCGCKKWHQLKRKKSCQMYFARLNALDSFSFDSKTLSRWHFTSEIKRSHQNPWSVTTRFLLNLTFFLKSWCFRFKSWVIGIDCSAHVMDSYNKLPYQLIFKIMNHDEITLKTVAVKCRWKSHNMEWSGLSLCKSILDQIIDIRECKQNNSEIFSVFVFFQISFIFRFFSARKDWQKYIYFQYLHLDLMKIRHMISKEKISFFLFL